MLDSLHIKNFRCFEDLTIPSLGRVNLIVGKNNSGKTTLLDAIYLYANRGNIWAIHQILLNRNESLQIDNNQQSNILIPQPNNQARTIFDSLANILPRKNNSIVCSITAIEHTMNSVCVELEKTNDIESTKRKHAIPEIQYPSLTIPPIQQEGFLVTARFPNILFPYHIASTPYSIINDILRITPEIPIISNSYIRTCTYQEFSLADTWSKLQDKGDDININKALKMIEPNISRAYYTVDGKIAKVQLDGIGTQTMKSLGEGVSKIFQLFILAYAAKGGILIIDEIENGLHYSIQEEVWEKLFRLAKELDIQIFATTHSEDAIKAFCKVAVAGKKVDGKLISLGRSAAIADNGKILADVYDGKTLAWIVQSGMEVR